MEDFKEDRRVDDPDHLSHKEVKEDQELESAIAEMGEVREENRSLKMYLDKIMKDYQTLQIQFYNIIQHDHQPNKVTTNPNNPNQEIQEPDQLVPPSLGRFCCDAKKNDDDEQFDYKEGLNLGLEGKFEASNSDASDPPKSSFEVQRKDDVADTDWPPSKVIKTNRSAGGDDEVLKQNPVKKTRVSVRARCDAPMVQRCAEDMSILITTFEGTHNHRLPISASAMASTTSVAASMLLSGSSSRSQASPGPSTTSANLHGLNNYYQSAGDTYKSSQFYIPCSSFSSSSHTSHPTITLDLTSFPLSNNSHKNNNPIIRPPSPPPPLPPQQKSLLDTAIAAAAKAITANPSFQSALAAALTTTIGGNNNGCATTYLNNTNTSSTLNLHQPGGSLTFVAPPSSFPFSTSWSSTASKAENGDQTN